ncbi:MAG: putative transcriptional regulatory protein [Microgenomates bacterium OLB23]|nr:MAG: putative transcriptional regulatory protein [Microgenomates bacterium OLB23]
MSGHSKWANIKRKKGVNDAQRSAVFTKMSRIISTAVHEGGGIGDPDKNFKLRLAIERAKAVNMPKDTIQRAIDKAIGGDGSQMKELLYEAFGPHGVAVLVLATTDNPNRTYAEVKLALEKNGGKMASPNSVAYQFTKCGILELKKSETSEEQAYALVDELGAFDLEEDDETYVLYIPFEKMGKVQGNIDVYYRPSTTVSLTEPEEAKVNEYIEKLEDLDDVMNVYTNQA